MTVLTRLWRTTRDVTVGGLWCLRQNISRAIHDPNPDEMFHSIRYRLETLTDVGGTGTLASKTSSAMNHR